LATDQDCLHKATKEIAKYWRNKRERRQSPLRSSQTSQQLAQPNRRLARQNQMNGFVNFVFADCLKQIIR
jgi:hypothetical protein